MVTGWTQVERGPDGYFAAPHRIGPDEVCFVEGSSGTVSWGRIYPAADADLAAAREWVLTAGAVAAAAAGEAVATVGEGALAALLRLAVSPDLTVPDTPPGVVAETTGTTAGIMAALQLVRPRGSVVLAARPLRTATPLRTYHDLHRPEVRLASVVWGGGDPRSAPDELVAWALAHLVSSPSGQPVPGLWHRLVSGGGTQQPTPSVEENDH